MIIHSLEQLKEKLKNIKNEADKAKIKEEYLTKQLKDSLDCDSLEEAIELLEQLIEEKKEIDNTIKEKTNIIIDKMKKEKFI